jgi:hypothetical protein
MRPFARPDLTETSPAFSRRRIETEPIAWIAPETVATD